MQCVIFKATVQLDRLQNRKLIVITWIGDTYALNDKWAAKTNSNDTSLLLFVIIVRDARCTSTSFTLFPAIYYIFHESSIHFTNYTNATTIATQHSILQHISYIMLNLLHITSSFFVLFFFTFSPQNVIVLQLRHCSSYSKSASKNGMHTRLQLFRHVLGWHFCIGDATTTTRVK